MGLVIKNTFAKQIWSYIDRYKMPGILLKVLHIIRLTSNARYVCY